MAQPPPPKESDIYYKDDNICILNPSSEYSEKYGVFLYHKVGYTKEIGAELDIKNVCINGLKSFNKLIENTENNDKKSKLSILRHRAREKINENHHNYIYFRPPYSCPRDGEMYGREFSDYFNGDNLEEIAKKFRQRKETNITYVVIKVDPFQTYIFNSNLRVHANLSLYFLEQPNLSENKRAIYEKRFEKNIEYAKNELKESRIKLSDYLEALQTNNKMILYRVAKPLSENEVVALVPEIPSSAFYSCNSYTI